MGSKYRKLSCSCIRKAELDQKFDSTIVQCKHWIYMCVCCPAYYIRSLVCRHISSFQVLRRRWESNSKKSLILQIRLELSWSSQPQIVAPYWCQNAQLILVKAFVQKHGMNGGTLQCICDGSAQISSTKRVCCRSQNVSFSARILFDELGASRH